MENTIGKRFRTLRVLYNRAIEEHFVKSDLYPFRTFKVSKLHQATAKRAISKEDVARVISFACTSPHDQLAIDLFTFSYFMGGINFGDMAFLTADNIVDGRLIYTRRKTRKLIRLPMQPRATEVLERQPRATETLNRHREPSRRSTNNPNRRFVPDSMVSEHLDKQTVTESFCQLLIDLLVLMDYPFKYLYKEQVAEMDAMYIRK